MGIGVFVLIALGFVAISMVPKMMQPGARGLAEREIEAAREKDSFTEAQLEVYEELAAVTEPMDVNGMVALLCASILHEHFKDGVIEDAEIEEAEVVLGFLEENPDTGLMGVMSFMRAHPEIGKKVQAVQRRPTLLQP